MPVRKTRRRLSPVEQALQHLFSLSRDIPVPEIFSYRQDFEYLWGIGRYRNDGFLENHQHYRDSSHLVIWDGVPDTNEESTIDVGRRLSAYDWLAAIAVRHSQHPVPVSVTMLDLSPPAYLHCFGADMAPMLLRWLPWFSRYRP